MLAGTYYGLRKADRRVAEGMGIYWAIVALHRRNSASPPWAKEECETLDAGTSAVDRLQKICSELTELHAELKESGMETSALRVVQDTVDQMRMTAMTLQQGLEWFRLSKDKQSLLTLLIDERMLRASQLNTHISKDFEAGRIRTDHAALSGYLLVLNRLMEQLDLIFGSRKGER